MCSRVQSKSRLVLWNVMGHNIPGPLPVARVIAQQYSSIMFLSLHSHSRQDNVGDFQEYKISFVIVFRMRDSEKCVTSNCVIRGMPVYE